MLVLQLLADCASPMFGYELCARWLEHKENHKYDFSAWRVAGVDAEMIRKEAATEGFWNFEAYKTR